MLLMMVLIQLHVKLLPAMVVQAHSGFRQWKPFALALTRCATLGKLYTLLGLSFFICDIGTITEPSHSIAGKIQWDDS